MKIIASSELIRRSVRGVDASNDLVKKKKMLMEQFASENIIVSYTNESKVQSVLSILSWLQKHVDKGAHLCSNSLNIQHGDVFMAFVLDGIDNRSYIGDAIQRGAVAIIWQPSIEGTPEGADFFTFPKDVSVPNIAVLNLGFLIGVICSKWYGEPSNDLLIVGVTGTNGKTTVSYWIASALEYFKKSCAIIGTLGSGRVGNLRHTGFTTPDAAQLQLELQGLRSAGVQAVSMEVSSHALAQRRVEGVAFDIAVFTNFTWDHLDYHKTLNNYRSAKASLFSDFNLGTLIINCHDALGIDLIHQYAEKKTIIAYTAFPPNSEIVQLAKICQNFRLLQAYEIRFDSTGVSFKLRDSVCTDICSPYYLKANFFGLHNVENLLAVISVCFAIGINPNKLSSILSELPQVPGRMQFIRGSNKGKGPLVIIDYAHTPDALKKCLETAKEISVHHKGRVIVIFGCGGNRDAAKRPAMGRIASEFADSVVLTNDNPRYENPYDILNEIYDGVDDLFKNKVKIIADRELAIIETIQNDAKIGDVVLIAGKGHEKVQIFLGKEYPFSDENYARFALDGYKNIHDEDEICSQV